MKLFLVVSDTHGDISRIKEVISHYPQIKTLIHLGDYCRDALEVKKHFPDIEFFMVSGNCDFSSNIPAEKLLEVEGKRLLLTHGHHYNVKSNLDRLRYKVLEDNYDAVLFGHTHIPFLEKNNILFLNPGSLGYPKGLSGATYALLEVSKGVIEARILDL